MCLESLQNVQRDTKKLGNIQTISTSCKIFVSRSLLNVFKQVTIQTKHSNKISQNGRRFSLEDSLWRNSQAFQNWLP